jgi:hypothetical protein
MATRIAQSRMPRLFAVAILALIYSAMHLGATGTALASTAKLCHGQASTIVGTSGDDTMTRSKATRATTICRAMTTTTSMADRARTPMTVRVTSAVATTTSSSACVSLDQERGGVSAPFLASTHIAADRPRGRLIHT